MYFLTVHIDLSLNYIYALTLNFFKICFIYLFRAALYKLILVLHKNALLQ